jgi:hypothetical protein
MLSYHYKMPYILLFKILKKLCVIEEKKSWTNHSVLSQYAFVHFVLYVYTYVYDIIIVPI